MCSTHFTGTWCHLPSASTLTSSTRSVVLKSGRTTSSVPFERSGLGLRIFRLDSRCSNLFAPRGSSVPHGPSCTAAHPNLLAAFGLSTGSWWDEIAQIGASVKRSGKIKTVIGESSLEPAMSSSRSTSASRNGKSAWSALISSGLHRKQEVVAETNRPVFSGSSSAAETEPDSELNFIVPIKNPNCDSKAELSSVNSPSFLTARRAHVQGSFTASRCHTFQ